MTDTPKMPTDAWELWAEGLTATIHGDHQIVNAVLLDDDVPLSHLVLMGYVAVVNLLAVVSSEDDQLLEDALPEWLAELRASVVAG